MPFRMRAHIDDGNCRSRQLRQKLKEEGWIAPSDLNVSVNTLQMLARHAGIQLRLEPIRCVNYGSKWRDQKLYDRQKGDYDDRKNPTEQFMPEKVYVAPTWLCELAAAWRCSSKSFRSRRTTPFPKDFLKRLPEVVGNKPLQQALLVQLRLQRSR